MCFWTHLIDFARVKRDESARHRRSGGSIEPNCSAALESVDSKTQNTKNLIKNISRTLIVSFVVRNAWIAITAAFSDHKPRNGVFNCALHHPLTSPISDFFLSPKYFESAAEITAAATTAELEITFFSLFGQTEAIMLFKIQLPSNFPNFWIFDIKSSHRWTSTSFPLVHLRWFLRFAVATAPKLMPIKIMSVSGRFN